MVCVVWMPVSVAVGYQGPGEGAGEGDQVKKQENAKGEQVKEQEKVTR